MNDQIGHETGDAFIWNFGREMLTSICNHDLVIHLGSDEFVVVLRGLKREIAARKAQLMQIIGRIQLELHAGWINWKPSIFTDCFDGSCLLS